MTSRTYSALASRNAVLYLLLAAGLFLANGCERGPAEKAGEKIDDAVEDVGDKIEDVGDEIEDAADKVND